MKRTLLAIATAALVLTATASRAEPWALHPNTGSKVAQSCSLDGNGRTVCAAITLMAIDPNTDHSQILMSVMFTHSYDIKGGQCRVDIDTNSKKEFGHNTMVMDSKGHILSKAATTSEMSKHDVTSNRAMLASIFSPEFKTTVNCPSSGVDFSVTFNPGMAAMDWITENKAFNLEYTDAKTTGSSAGDASN